MPSYIEQSEDLLVCFTQRPLLDVYVKGPLSVNCYFFLPTAAEICGGILFSHSFCSDLPTTQCQTPHVKNSTNARKETQKSRINVKVDSVHRSSHDGSSKLLKESTTHICPENNSHTSRGLLTCCINLTHMFCRHRWLWWCRRCVPTAGLLGSIRAPYRRAQDFELNLLNQYFKRRSTKDRNSPSPPPPTARNFGKFSTFLQKKMSLLRYVEL